MQGDYGSHMPWIGSALSRNIPKLAQVEEARHLNLALVQPGEHTPNTFDGLEGIRLGKTRPPVSGFILLEWGIVL